jgi:hypothetical protein
MINSFFHDTENGRIFCTLIAPSDSSAECIIYFSPLFEERMWSQRIAFNFARTLAERGRYSFLFFDYYGYGESSGNPEDFSLDRCRHDVESIIDMLKTKGFKRLAFWGLRSGSAVALASLPSGSIVSSALFWAPVFDLYEFITDCLRTTIANQYMLFKKIVAKRDVICDELLKFGNCSREGYILNHIDGYRFGKVFYQETMMNKNHYGLSEISIPTLIVEVSPYDKNNPESTTNLSNSKILLQRDDNIEIKTIIGKSFWIIGRDYSQRANDIYRITQEWLDRKASSL